MGTLHPAGWDLGVPRNFAGDVQHNYERPGNNICKATNLIPMIIIYDATQMPEATPGQWVSVVDSCYQAPYMTNGPYWIGYDDADSVTIKVSNTLIMTT